MTITLTGDQGYVQYKPSGLADNVDAGLATFHLRHSPAFLYPIDIRNASDRTFLMGKMVGEIDQAGDWRDVYALGNSAAFFIQSAPNFTLRGTPGKGSFDRVWDCFRPSGTSCNGFLLDGIMATNVRDDFVENDSCNSGTIRDCLVDGAYVSCMSMTDGGSTTRTNKQITLEDSLFKSKGFLVEGAVNQHGAPFKTNKNGAAYNPKIVVRRCVFAILRPDHNMSEDGGRLEVAFASMTEVVGSYWLNLSDVPLPSSYPKIPAGFTVLQGQAARDMWEQKRKAWRVAHGYETVPQPQPLPTPAGTLVSESARQKIVDTCAALDAALRAAGIVKA